MVLCNYTLIYCVYIGLKLIKMFRHLAQYTVIDKYTTFSDVVRSQKLDEFERNVLAGLTLRT